MIRKPDNASNGEQAAKEAAKKDRKGWSDRKAAGGLWRRPPGGMPQMQMRSIESTSGGGRFFDENGNVRRYSSAVSPSVFRLTPQLADREDSTRPFEENVWVRAAVKAISSGFQRMRFTVYDRDPSEDNATEIDLASIGPFWKKPNQLMTHRQFWYAHAVNMKLDGECVWFMMDEKGEPVEVNDDLGTLKALPATILPIRGALVQMRHDGSGMPIGYRYATIYGKQGSNHMSREFPPGSVVHFRDYDPYNLTRGLGDVTSLERETDLYFQAFRAMDGAVRNGGDPGGFLIYEQGVGPDEIERQQEMLDEEMQTPNQRRIKILQGNAKYVPNSTKPSDMQYREMVEWNRDSILSGIGVPPPVVGIYDSATYNNVETAHREMWTGPNGIISLGSLTTDTVTHDFFPRLARVVPQVADAVAVFDTSHIEILQEDVGGKLDRAAEIAAKGIGVSMNEVLTLQGVDVEESEQGDHRWVAQSLNDIEDPTIGKVQPPVGEGPDGGDAEPAEGEGEESLSASGSREGSAVPSVAFAITEGEQDYDPELKSRTETWLGRYEKEQRSRLRRISNRGLRKLSIFDEQFDPDAITEEAWAAMLLDHSEWAEKLDRATQASILKIWEFGLAEARGEVGGPIVSTSDPRIAEQLGAQRIRLSEGVTSTTSRRVRRALAKVFAEKASPGALRDMIREVLPELNESLTKVFGNKENRAASIAQTETGRAENGARMAQYEDSNVETVQWIASQDEAVRATHVSVHGTETQIGGRFANGLRYPHDPEAPPGEVVNCRCKLRAGRRRDPLDDPDLEIS